MNCPYCKAKLPEGSQFCPNCGQSIYESREKGSASSHYWSMVEKEVARDEKIRADTERKLLLSQKKKSQTVIASIIVLGIIGIIICYYAFFYPLQQYHAANELLNSGDYYGAIAIFKGLGNYKESVEQIDKCQEGIREQRYL